MSDDQLHIRLLGGFSVNVGDRFIDEGQWRLRRAAQLVKMLALAPRHQLSREMVIEAMWPGAEPGQGMINVRKTAFHARRVLGMQDGIMLDDGMVKLAPGHTVGTDVDAFTTAAHQALIEDSAEGCRDAAALYGGDLLPSDLYAQWCAAERDHLRSLFRDVLAGGQMWGRLVRDEPTHELAHREILRAQLAAGDRAAAIRQFEQLRTSLREELGVSPEPETVALYEQVLSMDGRESPTPADRARALLAWGMVHWRRADLDEAARTADEVRALAIDAQLPRELSEASELMGLVSYAQGTWQAMFPRIFLESVTHTPALAPFIFDANMCMSEFALCERTGTADVDKLAREMLRAGAGLESTQAQALGHLLRGEAALLAGKDVDHVRQDLLVAARLHEAGASVTGWALAVERLAQLDAVEQRRRDADHGHREALRIAERTSVPEHLLPCIYGGMISNEDDDVALQIIAEAEAATEHLTVCDPCSMGFRVSASMVCSRTGETDRARGYLAEASRVAEMWNGGPWHAAVDEASAALEQAHGAPATVVSERLQQAGAGFLAANRPRDAARCRAAAAALQ
ncbi:AfsR/SARP family transcriptional regulator [Arthrobacter castelli]|uniref:AfsR/SARP family transcriptional regulator n=1 Tax=Arthrobacter castelli TaxID=271431 RepID=UPI00040C3202|nr:BTAD domain-containing putative transcriptional regulator [Arthrobacter castelli]